MRSVPVPLVGDRCSLDRYDLADQPGEVGERSAEATAERVADRLELLVRGPLVDERDDAPGPWIEHVSRDLAHVDEREAADIDAADRAGVQVVGVD